MRSENSGKQQLIIEGNVRGFFHYNTIMTRLEH